MLSKFFPKSTPFFELLASQSILLQKQSLSLLDIIKNEQSQETITTLTSLKEEIYQQCITITSHLSQTFITPIDKEDIYTISISQKNLASNLYTFGIKLAACNHAQKDTSILKLLKNIGELLKLILSIVKALPQKSDISHTLAQINDKKTVGVNLLLETFFELQESEVSTPNELKKRLLLSIHYDQISKIIEQIQNIADILEQVMIKYV